MGIEYSTGFCEQCDENVKMQRSTPNHIFHFVMSVLTCGLWLLVWLSVASEKTPWICSRCGAKLGGGSNGWGLAGALLSSAPKPKAESTKNCLYCAEKIKAAAKICRYCGKELDTTPESKGICPYCGEKLVPGAKACQHCNKWLPGFEHN